MDHKMYLVKIEPVYSQGVGHFELITDNVKYVEHFLNELDRYKNYLKQLEENMEEWEFYEYVYKLVDFNSNTNKCSGHCVYDKYYFGNEEKIDRIILWEKNLDCSTELENFEYNNVVYKNNYVYNFFDDPSKPIYIDNFDIIGKNYLK